MAEADDERCLVRAQALRLWRRPADRLAGLGGLILATFVLVATPLGFLIRLQLDRLRRVVAAATRGLHRHLRAKDPRRLALALGREGLTGRSVDPLRTLMAADKTCPAQDKTRPAQEDPQSG